MRKSTKHSGISVQTIIDEINEHVRHLHPAWTPHLRSLIIEIKRVERLNKNYSIIRTKDVISSTPDHVLPSKDIVTSFFEGRNHINIPRLAQSISILLSNVQNVNDDVLMTHDQIRNITASLEPGTSRNHIEFQKKLDEDMKKTFKKAYALLFNPLLYYILLNRLDNAYYQNYTRCLDYIKRINNSKLQDANKGILISLWKKQRDVHMKPLDVQLRDYIKQAASLKLNEMAPDYYQNISRFVHGTLRGPELELVKQQKARVDSTCAAFNRVIKDLNIRVNDMIKSIKRLEKASDQQLEKFENEVARPPAC